MLKRLTEYLDGNSVRYVVMTHSPAFTAQEIAGAAHLSGKVIAKTVIVNIDGKMAMVVLHGSSMVDFRSLRHGAGAAETVLATEREFQELFPGCELGAMPPFGNLFDVEVIVDTSLASNPEIAFNAGSHRELIQMSYADFDRLVKPRLLSFGVPRHQPEVLEES